MNKLIRAYLNHIDHYQANSEIERYYSKLIDNELIYHVKVKDVTMWFEVIEISNDDLLAFLYERTLDKRGL
jgi:hypothetical protein